jgi:hypothetical protein
MTDKQSILERKVWRLQIFCTLVTVLASAFLVLGFTVQNKQKFAEIDVERINVVEKDGKLKMVISNRERQHPGAMDGKTYDERKGQRPAGMIFFNEKGDEIGGLIFDGDSGKGQGGSLTFDKFRGDQTIQFTHQEDKDGNYFAGLKMNDENMPLTDRISKIEAIKKLPTKEAQDAAYKEMKDKGEFLVNRLFIGRGRNKSSIIELSDAKGKARIALSVEPNGIAKLDFLDENGKVIYSLPDNAKAKK